MVKIIISFCAIFLALIVHWLEGNVLDFASSFELSILTWWSLWRLRFISLRSVVWYWCLELRVLLIIYLIHDSSLFHCEFHGSGSLLFVSVIFVHQGMLLLFRWSLCAQMSHFRSVLFAAARCTFVLLYFVNELLMSVLTILLGSLFNLTFINIWLHFSALSF